jgi:hypothetical protein
MSLDCTVTESQLTISVTAAREQFGNPEQRERPPFEAVTRGVEKTQLTEKKCCVPE